MDLFEELSLQSEPKDLFQELGVSPVVKPAETVDPLQAQYEEYVKDDGGVNSALARGVAGLDVARKAIALGIADMFTDNLDSYDEQLTNSLEVYNRIPTDPRFNYAVEQAGKEDNLYDASIQLTSHLMEHPGAAGNFLMEQLPSAFFGGGVGAGTGKLTLGTLFNLASKTGSKKVIETVAKGAIPKLVTGATQAAGAVGTNAYAANLQEGMEKFGDLELAKEYAARKTAGELPANMAAGMFVPFKIGSSPTNILTQATLQGAGGAAGAAQASYGVGEDINLGELAAEALGEFATVPVDIATMQFNRGQAGKDQKPEIRSKASPVNLKNAISDTYDNVSDPKATAPVDPIVQVFMEAAKLHPQYPGGIDFVPPKPEAPTTSPGAAPEQQADEGIQFERTVPDYSIESIAEAMRRVFPNQYEGGIDYTATPLPQFNPEILPGAGPGTQGGVDFTRQPDLSGASAVERAQAEHSRKQRMPDGLNDPRILRDPFRKGLEQMSSQLVKGGGISLIGGDFDPANDNVARDKESPVQRTASQNPQWFQSLVQEPEFAMSVEQFQKAVDKALKGEKLGVREARVIEAMLNVMTGERTDPVNVDSARERLQRAREIRKHGAPVDYDDQFIEQAGQIYEEQEYAPDWDAEARALNELYQEARRYNPAEADHILQDVTDDANAARQLWAIIKAGEINNAIDTRTTQRDDETGQTAPAGRDTPETSQPSQNTQRTIQQDGAVATASGRDLFGEIPVTQQALETRRQEIDDRLRGEDVPPESRGDLFDPNRGKQTDIADATASTDDLMNEFDDAIDGSTDDSAAPVYKPIPWEEFSKRYSTRIDDWNRAAREEGYEDAADYYKRVEKQFEKGNQVRSQDQASFTGDGLFSRNNITSVDESNKNAPAEPPVIDTTDDDTSTGKIQDFGEKIGGARKDTADSGYKMRGKKNQDERPAWMRRYSVHQVVATLNNKEEEGKWVIHDNKTERPVRDGYKTRLFDDEQDAVEAIPLIEVARNHRVQLARKENKTDPDSFQIVRMVSDKKRPVIKDGFSSRDEALEYMVEHAVEIIETKTRIDDSIHPALEKAIRLGEARRENDRDVTPKDFMDVFGFRGVEFGNWNNTAERQHILNQAYDAFLDLAEMLNIPPKAISLNGELALGFGSRGHGLIGAKAHYERDYGVINLTKIKGAGSLAHEWMHAFDHYLGRQAGQAKAEKVKNSRGDLVYPAGSREGDFVSHGFSYKAKGRVRQELMDAFNRVMDVIQRRTVEYTEDTSTRERIEQKRSEELDKKLDDLRKMLARDYSNDQYKPYRGVKNNKPATAEQLKKVDDIIARIKSGDYGEEKPAPNSKSRYSPVYLYERAAELSQIYKEVRGRQGFGKDSNGHGHGIIYDISRAIATKKYADQYLADAKEQKIKEKKIATEFYSQAWKLDTGTAGDYWSTPHELLARAFESYIYDRLKDTKARNDFLSYEKHNDLPEYRMFGVKPYPEGDERSDINQSFVDLFNTIKTEETDQGVRMYSRAGKQVKGTSSRTLKNSLINNIKQWKNAPTVQVFQTIDELRTVDPAAPSDVEAAWINGKIYFVSDNLADVNRAIEVLLHETVGHHGLRSLLGKNLDSLLDDVWRAWEAGSLSEPDNYFNLKNIAESYDYDLNKTDDRRKTAEEYIARLAERGKESNFIDRLIVRIAQWIRKHIPSFKFTRAEVLQLIAESKEYIQRGNEPEAVTGNVVPAYSRQYDTKTQDMFGTDDSANNKDLYSSARNGKGLWWHAYTQRHHLTALEQIGITGNNAEILSRTDWDKLPRQVRDQLIEKDVKYTHKGVYPVDSDSMFSRSADTQTAYENRIDELFSGSPASRVGIKVLDSSDILTMLGFDDLPVHVNENKIETEQVIHKLTIEHWKKIPEWLENPVAVFDSDTVPGRLVFIAPELHESGMPIVMIVAPDTSVGHIDVHLLVNSYDRSSLPPMQRWVNDGLLRYIDQKQSLAFSRTSGLRLPRVNDLQRGYNQKIFSDRDLVKFRQDNTRYSRATDDTAPVENRSFAEIYQSHSKPLWNRMAAASRALLARVKLADETPNEIKAMLREMRADVVKAGEKASTIANAAGEMTQAEKDMISDYIEGELATGVTPPEHVLEIATAMQAALREQGDELVALEMLSEKAESRLRDKYLARYYAKHVMDNPFDKALRNMVRSMKIQGNRLKGRGLHKAVSKSRLDKWQKLGWELRDNRDLSKLKGTDKVTIWRDFTKEERVKMGEIRDGVYRYAKGYLEAQKDIAMGRLFKRLAESEWASDAPVEDWIQVPETKVPGTADVKRYGMLAGKYVPEQVWDHLKAIHEPKGDLYRAYLKALSFWKEGKTSMNPVVHSNNVVSNLFMAYFALGNKSLKLYAPTFREYRTKGKYYQEAIDNGLFGTEFYDAEIRQMLPDIEAFRDIETAAAGMMTRTLDTISKYSGIRTYREKMGRLYQAEDQFFKLMVYKEMRENGASVDESIREAERWFFNYADIPEGVRKIKTWWLPFFSYTYKAVPALAYTAVNAPWRMAVVGALFAGLNWLAYESLFGDEGDDEERKERELLPDYMKGMTAIWGVPKSLRLPFNDENGEALFLDLSRRMPLGDLFDATNQMGGIPLLQPLTPNNPALTILGGMIWNIDSFSGRDIVDEIDDNMTAAEKRAAWLLRQVLPNTPVLPGSYSWNKVMNGMASATGKTLGDYTGKDYMGREASLPRALADVLLGFKIRPVDVEGERDRKLNDLRGQQYQVRSGMRSTLLDQRLSDENRQERFERLREKMDLLNEQMTETSNL